MIDIPPPREQQKLYRNWRDTDWKQFRTALKEELTTIPAPVEITTKDQFDTAVKALGGCINKTVKKIVKSSSFTPFWKRWWTQELTDTRNEFHHISTESHQHRMEPNHPIHDTYKTAHNAYTERIRKTKEEHWTQWLED